MEPPTDKSRRDRIPLARGVVIARRYIVIRCLGRGSGGTIYLCQDRHNPGENKALKVLADVGESDVLFARFYREAKAAQRVDSPYVVRSFDVVVDDGVFAYTMEYIPGQSLAELLQDTPRPALSLVCRALREIAEGLAAVHDAGLIHRDLKPSNVLITQQLRFKIADFGIVLKTGTPVVNTQEFRILTVDEHTPNPDLTAPPTKLTKTGEVLGTVDYLSPEYLLHNKVDALSDIYSLGTVAFEMLAGQVPFPSGMMMQRLAARIKAPAPELSSLRPDIPPALTELVMRCLSRNCLDRPQSAEEFSKLLQAVSQSGVTPQMRISLE